MSKKIEASLQIGSYIHCGKCLDELPECGHSPQSWGQIEAGFTKIGLQIWCKRHNINIVHIDFEGQKHPANLEAK